MKTHRLALACALASLTLLFQAGCSTAASPPTPLAANPTPVLSTDTAVRLELLQLDTFLDTKANLALESALRQNSSRIGENTTLPDAPSWNQFAAGRPALRSALGAEPRFLLHRALARMTGRLPLERTNLRLLGQFLDAHPAIEREIEANPALLVDQDFLILHPSLAAFFGQHPDLFSVFNANASRPAPLTAARPAAP